MLPHFSTWTPLHVALSVVQLYANWKVVRKLFETSEISYSYRYPLSAAAADTALLFAKISLWLLYQSAFIQVCEAIELVRLAPSESWVVIPLALYASRSVARKLLPAQVDDPDVMSFGEFCLRGLQAVLFLTCFALLIGSWTLLAISLKPRGCVCPHPSHCYCHLAVETILRDANTTTDAVCLWYRAAGGRANTTVLLP